MCRNSPMDDRSFIIWKCNCFKCIGMVLSIFCIWFSLKNLHEETTRDIMKLTVFPHFPFSVMPNLPLWESLSIRPAHPISPRTTENYGVVLFHSGCYCFSDRLSGQWTWSKMEDGARWLVHSHRLHRRRRYSDLWRKGNVASSVQVRPHSS